MGWARAYWSRAVAGTALAAVAAVTGRISYTHIYSLTLTLHQPVSTARLMPFGVDGLIVVGSVVLLQSVPGQRYLGWVAAGPGVVISLFANVESGLQWGALSAAWAGVSSLAFALSTFVFERWLKAQVTAGKRDDGTVPATAGPVLPEAAPEPAPEPALEPPPGTVSSLTGTVPLDAEAAAALAYRSTLIAGNALSQNQLIDRFSLTRAQATRVRKTVDASMNGGGGATHEP